MRLLHLLNDHLSVDEFYGTQIPPYGILSHTWGSDSDEVTLKDIIDGAGQGKAGYRKILFCARQAAKDGLEYSWVDTCCIDKSSSAELSEAINSMFRWYREAAKCYVYLSDISTKDIHSFQASRWFTRGWTLQELLAPKVVDFYTVEGEYIGDRSSHMQEIESVTRIPRHVLEGVPLSELTVGERLHWATTRTTKREEDRAYSLLGIFDVHMPLIYGEGSEKAFLRLQEEISKSSSGEAYSREFHPP